jgi:hypothetical protein
LNLTEGCLSRSSNALARLRDIKKESSLLA